MTYVLVGIEIRARLTIAPRSAFPIGGAPPNQQQCVPPWLHLVSKTLQSAVDGLNDAAASGGGGVGTGTGTAGSGGEEAGAARGDSFGVELEGLRTAMALLEHVPS